MRRGVIVVVVTAVATWIAAGSFAGDVDREQEQVEAELAALEREHAALQEWVAEELRPWAGDVADVVDEGAPGAPGTSPAPWASPIPTLAPLPSPSSAPTPSPEPSPSPPSPSLLPSPSLCLPIVCEESPSP
jgi:hypothetical protein